MIELGVIVGLFGLIGFLIWRLVRARSAREKDRADALERNLEASNDAARHLDDDLEVDGLLARARRRRELRRRSRT